MAFLISLNLYLLYLITATSRTLRAESHGNSKSASRHAEAEIKAVDIHDGLDSTLMILQHRLRASGKNPELQVIKEYGNLPKVECYAGQLNQVFMNLLTNAIDTLEELVVGVPDLL